MLADQLDYVVGVDPHRDTHALAIVDVCTGAIVLEASVAASSSGYARALELAELHAPARRAFAIEGTGSFGAGLTRFLADRDERVLEVGRLRRERRSGGKTDALDARLRYRLVDVFTDRPLSGNPLCVVLDPCPSELMQKIAREANLSETTFPSQTGDDSYEMRIFSPIVELPFAGRPSIGTAWLLGPRRWTQVTSGATVIVEADEHGAKMTQPEPQFEPLEEGAGGDPVRARAAQR
jgi:hypothetical protein